VISQRYSHPELALRSLEQTTSAVILATLAGEQDVPQRYREEANAALRARASPTAR
jgi:phosphoenolpyruvate carboxylase